MGEKKRILFLCTGNSCRSQMAEGFAREMYAKSFDVFSAGIEKHGINENAMQVMKEAGIDISGQFSKTTAELEGKFDYVITVCGHADENCPYFPAKTKVIHRGFDDPPKLAKDAETEEEKMFHYRRVRDEIQEFMKDLPGLLYS